MNSIGKAALALVLSVGFCSVAVAEDTVPAKVISIKKYLNGRVVDWDRYVAIYDRYPVYDMTLGVGEKTYVVRYESMTGYYPSAWNVGSTIQVKKEGGRFVLSRGEERIPAKIVSDHDCVPQPTRTQSAPQLPCPD
jgi:hypothetical protein